MWEAHRATEEMGICAHSHGSRLGDTARRVGRRTGHDLLEENPTTGYRWQAAIDETMLRPVDDSFEPASDATGAGGTRRLTFEVVHDGAIELRLRKVRSWQPDDAVEEFAVTLDATWNAT